jgi:hypothetical protein
MMAAGETAERLYLSDFFDALQHALCPVLPRIFGSCGFSSVAQP